VVLVISILSVYIATPVKAVDITTIADKSDSNVNFVLRSLKNPTRTVCHEKRFNELSNFTNNISSKTSYLTRSGNMITQIHLSKSRYNRS
jgi:hypothetical protein